MMEEERVVEEEVEEEVVEAMDGGRGSDVGPQNPIILLVLGMVQCKGTITVICACYQLLLFNSVTLLWILYNKDDDDSHC